MPVKLPRKGRRQPPARRNRLGRGARPVAATPRRRRIAAVPSASALLVAGAAAEYLLDPEQGRGRRTRLMDQARAAVRHRRREAERAARYADGVRRGASAEARGAGTFTPADDRAIAGKLKEVLAGSAVDTTDVTVEVASGVATLRGQVLTDDEADRLVRACQEVNGVERVESFLHLPGQPAPNKADARRVGDSSGNAVHHGA